MPSAHSPPPPPELETIDPLLHPKWDALIALHPQASFFHSSAWARVLSKTYHHFPLYLHFHQNHQTLALLPLFEVSSFLTPRRAISLPFTDLAPPLLFANTPLHRLLPSLQSLAHQRHWNSFELRGASLPPPLTPSVQFYTHQLDLQPDPPTIASQFSTSTRRAIRKSQKAPLQVEISQSKSTLLQFYQLHEKTRRHHGVPPQPLHFFLQIYQEIIKPGLGWIVIAHHHHTPAAAAIFFLHHHHAIYKFGASDLSLQHLHPNHLVFATAIHHLQHLHAHSLHFGRTSLHNEGLRRFKKSWGATEEIIAYSKFHLPTMTWITSRDSSRGLHNSLFSRLPLALNRLAGSLLYPHLD